MRASFKALLTAGLLVAGTSVAAAAEKLKVVTTFTIIADMTLEDIDALKCFLKNNVCPDICMEEVYKKLDELRECICQLRT